MRSPWKFLLVCSAMGILLSLTGCRSGNEGEKTSDATASGGTSSKATGNGSPGTAPPSAHAPGAIPGAPTAVPVRQAVVIETSMGNVTVELDREKAPATVDNFLGYVEKGFYDGTIFHQVFPGAVILGGTFTEDLQEKPAGPPVNNEAHNGLKNQRGTIAMARQEDVINSATSQFFINLKDNPNYDHDPAARETYDATKYGYCVFGRVTEDSMDVVDRIGSVEAHDVEVPDKGLFEMLPDETVLIRSIRRIP